MVDRKKIQSARGTRTQRQYALALGVDQMVVSRWERGETQPTLENLVRIAADHGKPIEWFLKEEAAA